MSLTILVAEFSISSTLKNISGMTTLLLAESSKVRSNNIIEALSQAVLERFTTNRAREQICSAFIGFFLNGIAEEPTWDFPKGSCHSPNPGDCIILKSKANLFKDPAIPANKFAKITSIFRGA